MEIKDHQWILGFFFFFIWESVSSAVENGHSGVLWIVKLVTPPVNGGSYLASLFFFRYGCLSPVICVLHLFLSVAPFLLFSFFSASNDLTCMFSLDLFSVFEITMPRDGSLSSQC